MTLTLTVETASWRRQLDTVAASYAPLVPVVKGNGYGFGRPALTEVAVTLVTCPPARSKTASTLGFTPTIAVGTAHELAPVPDPVRQLVLTPATAGQVPLLEAHRPIATLGDPADVDALNGWRGPVLIKLASSMRRFGIGPDQLPGLLDRAAGAGLDVLGASIHLPLAGDDAGRVTEVDTWLPRLEGHLTGAGRQLWVSHLAPEAHRRLGARHPDWSFPMRVGTRLWHGDKSALHLGADVLAVREVSAGDVAGYHATPVPGEGTLAIVGAGSAHGVAPLDDGRSPFHFARHRLALLEQPHMHVSILFVPAGAPTPAVGDTVDVQRPLISVSVDRTVWAGDAARDLPEERTGR